MDASREAGIPCEVNDAQILLLTGLIAGADTCSFVVALYAAFYPVAQETPPSTATAVITGTVVTSKGPRLQRCVETGFDAAHLMRDLARRQRESTSWAGARSGRWLLVPSGAARDALAQVSAAYVQSTARWWLRLGGRLLPPRRRLPTATPTVGASAGRCLPWHDQLPAPGCCHRLRRS